MINYSFIPLFYIFIIESLNFSEDLRKKRNKKRNKYVFSAFYNENSMIFIVKKEEQKEEFIAKFLSRDLSRSKLV
jgi:hypothetical protein